MAGKFARSWQLTKQAWSVLRDDKRLLVFPLISGTLVTGLILSCVAGVIAAIAAFDTGATSEGAFEQFMAQYGPWKYVAIFLLYVVTYSIVTFFQAALLACAIDKFDGKRPTISGGLKAAWSRIHLIIAWSLVNATVGVALQMLQERLGFLARIFVGLAGIAWNIATFFVVPVLVIEGVGPVEAIKRSAGVIRKTWGESLITQFGFTTAMSLIGALLFFALLAAGIGLSVALDSGLPIAILLPLAFLMLLLLAIVQSAMKTLLIAATYRFAESGVAAGPFQPEQLQAMFKPKKRRGQ